MKMLPSLKEKDKRELKMNEKERAEMLVRQAGAQLNFLLSKEAVICYGEYWFITTKAAWQRFWRLLKKWHKLTNQQRPFSQNGHFSREKRVQNE